MEKSYIQYLREMVEDKMVILNSTAVVLVDDLNRILLQKRSDNLLWGLPGGILEMNETIQEGAIREVKEETNLDVELTRFIGVFINPEMTWNHKDKAKVICFAFLGEVTGGYLNTDDQETLELRYFDYSELPQIHSIDNLRIIQAYYNNDYNVVEGVKY